MCAVCARCMHGARMVHQLSLEPTPQHSLGGAAWTIQCTGLLKSCFSHNLGCHPIIALAVSPPPPLPKGWPKENLCRPPITSNALDALPPPPPPSKGGLATVSSGGSQDIDQRVGSHGFSTAATINRKRLCSRCFRTSIRKAIKSRICLLQLKIRFRIRMLHAYMYHLNSKTTTTYSPSLPMLYC